MALPKKIFHRCAGQLLPLKTGNPIVVDILMPTLVRQKKPTAIDRCKFIAESVTYENL